MKHIPDLMTLMEAPFFIFRHGPLHTFEVTKSGNTGWEIEKMLRLYGIPMIGRDTTEHTVLFSVPMKQAVWTEYLLLRSGKRVITELVQPSHRNVREGDMPPPWGATIKAKSFTGKLVDLIDALL